MMFNLNITQIRCYVLMKMLLKTYINQKDEDNISSFMCKTILLHLAKNLRSNIWQENNLFKCLSIYISALQNCISNGQCPHFFIPENNLMGRKFSTEIKLILTERVQQLIYSYGQALLGIEIDELGQRILSSVNSLHRIEKTVAPNGKSKEVIAGSLSRDVFDRHESHLQTLAQLHKLDFSDVFAITSLLHCISKLTVCNKQANSLEKLAVRLLVPLLYSTLGSVIASCNTGFDRCVPEGALALFLAGIRSDILSGWLKLASALYCSGEYEKTEIILRIIGGQPEINSAQVICGCYNPGDPAIYAELARVSNERNEEAARQAITICIKFLPSEMNCVPHELLYEMFRSTEEDIQNRSDFEIWMDWAVVDCVSYLYFLQYKTYGHLRKRAEQQRALRNLAKTIDADFRLRHRETALNLLGQCLEHEGRGTHALQCYMRSINIRERNNAARMHICMLLSNLINRN
ncbi:uncharacterized protein LOC123534561 [Mercenaria mercenaria]|uniref:uncharacterized protein LOC123534561 n=1 Tax=Mercenaria mercenaria TaxID=6596 RepID=UPI00234EA600|nr:uncharacterized protein LOC123534561 [Mercenaria mercenaria]